MLRDRWTRLPATLRLAVPGIALAALVLVPNLGRAFTIDDTLFLREAEHARVDPLHPTAFDYVWSEADFPRRMSEYVPSGPGMAWLLSTVVRSASPEIAGHAVQFALLVVTIIATVALGLRLGLRSETARAAGFLLAASPVVLAMSATCMPDTPAMAFGAVGVERTLAWRERATLPRALAAAFFLAAGTLTRSHAGLLAGVALLFAVRRPCPDPDPMRRLVGRIPLPPLMAVAISWVVLRVTRDPSTGADVVTATSNFHPAFHPTNAFACAIGYALALPFGLGMMLASPVRFVTGRAMCFAAPAAFALAMLCRVDDDWLIVSAAVGAGAVLGALGGAILRRRPNLDEVALAGWLLLPIPVIWYLHMPPKYLLVSAPAASVLLARALERRGAAGRYAISGALAAAGVALGVLIIRADGEMADLARRAAAELVAPAVREGKPVWFAAHWGAQWYFENAGAKPLVVGAPLKPGDLLIESDQVHGRIVDGLRGRTLVQSVDEKRPGGRIMSGGAGFYSNAWGFYPWVWSAETTDDRITLWSLR